MRTPAEPGGLGAKRRLTLAGGTALSAGLVVVAVLFVVPSSRPAEDPAAIAPIECLERWSEDPEAVEYTRHNAIFHNYEKAQVGYLPGDVSSTAVTPAPAREGGACVVVFARADLDPETVAAGMVYRSDAWMPLSELVEVDELAAMQAAAVEGANAQPTPAGELERLE